MINGLDLFSGIGGLTLALGEWVRPIAYCENDRYAQCVLLSRMGDGSLPTAPIWDDVRTLSRSNIGQLRVEIIYGGFPCQDISAAGNGAGLAGERSGLFFEIARLTKEIKPKFVFLENVSAILSRGLDQILKTFTELGYDCRWEICKASDVGAPHRRARWWFLAYTNDKRSSEIKKIPRRSSVESTRDDWWKNEPCVDRVVNGLPFRVDRIKGLGNAVVPQQAREAFVRLMGLNA